MPLFYFFLIVIERESINIIEKGRKSLEVFHTISFPTILSYLKKLFGALINDVPNLRVLVNLVGN